MSFPLVDGRFILPHGSIRYFEGLNWDDFVMKSYPVLPIVDTNFFLQRIPLSQYNKLEQDMIDPYTTIVEIARSKLSPSDADKLIDSLKDLRVGFANKLKVVYDSPPAIGSSSSRGDRIDRDYNRYNYRGYEE